MSRKRKKRTNLHHRRSRQRTNGIGYNGFINGVPNLICVDYKKHQAFHLLFPDDHPKEIAKELNDTWTDPEWVLIPVKRNDLNKLKKILKEFT